MRKFRKWNWYALLRTVHPPIIKNIKLISYLYYTRGTCSRPLICFTFLFLMPVLSFSQQMGTFYVRGTVVDEVNERPLDGTSIRLLGGRIVGITDSLGNFSLSVDNRRGILVFSRTGCEKKEVPFDLNTELKEGFKVRLKQLSNSLDDVQVIGYGTVSRRLNTGSVVSVNGSEIAKQPVSNPLASLAGRVPGMTVAQNSGNAGSRITVQIRGRNSIAQGSEPLFLIDGVPFPNSQLNGGMTALANGGQSPMNNINPQDIESIDVLKDADATAIYGSRGANGVVLITTKKGQQGVMRGGANVFHGIGKVNPRLNLLNTEQYLMMRREAFANDRIEPTGINAPDLLLWDTTRYTDWQEYLIGGTAHFTNANFSLSGGGELTQYLVGANYNRQGAVYPGRYYNNRGGASMSVTHRSADKRFSAMFSSNFSIDNNELPGNDLTGSITLPPNHPVLFDDHGNLVWEENGGTFSNPLSYLKRKTSARTDNLLANANLQYRLLDGLIVRVTGGYNLIQLDQIDTWPAAAIDPNSSSIAPNTSVSNARSKSWIIEPQLEYSLQSDRHRFNVLLGTTMQSDVRNMQLVEASGFPNDGVMEAIAFASQIDGESSKVDYRYQALFGRVNYNYDGKYLFNLTGRRDGSSRFGPDRKVANFGALGIGWIFSEESLLQDRLAFLSFGKLRGSYGVTGNDQIGDYQYLDNYGAVSYPYQGEIGYLPARLFNSDYSWERNNKLEFGLELGFLSDRIQFASNWFRNRSDSQLVNYRLPSQVGFSSILRNYGALVENSGWEFVLSANPKLGNNFLWTTSINVSFNRNKLLEFPGLETSSYANTLVIGQPLSVRKHFQFIGVDPTSGQYTFNGTVVPTDQTVLFDPTPKYFGGFNNDFSFKGWNLSFLLQFVKQEGYNYYQGFSTGSAPGIRRNQPLEVLDRWQSEGDQAKFQRFTTTGEALRAYNNFVNYSDGVLTDASFVRLKNLHLSYRLPPTLLSKLRCRSLRIYAQGQNLFTITNFLGMDPETGATSTLPPMAVYTIGLNLGF